MPLLTIQGTIIDFPDSATSPNWAPAVIDFAEAVTDALESVVGTYDISPRSMAIDATPNDTPTDIPALAFPVTQVRGAYIQYTVFRTTSTTTVSETGNLMLNYNPVNGATQKWEFTRDAVGNSQVTFSVLDTGQVQISLTGLSGIDHVGTLNYTAKAIQQVY